MTKKEVAVGPAEIYRTKRHGGRATEQAPPAIRQRHTATQPQTISVDEYLSKKELAKLCRCSERTIDRLIEVGEAPPITRLSARRIIFSAALAREWLSRRTSGAAP
jgi:predicted DNA-binding transcriptional regulator AlpA